MTDPELWVIDPSVSHPETQGTQEVLRDWDGPARVFRPGLEPGSGPGPGVGYPDGGVVLMGSAASVHDSPPWLAPLATWLRPMLRGEPALPLLGICFGHQLIAHLAGAPVGFNRDDRAKTVETSSTLLEGGRLLPGERELRVVISHREQVKRAPADYRVVARRPAAPIDGLEHGRLPIFSFQFHPEAREEFAAEAGIDPRTIDRRVREDGQVLLGSFRNVVRRLLLRR